MFGLLRMCQLVLPGMRAQGWGKIVNVSSMGGRLTFPGGGLYHATKYAVEALSDALRFEVKGFGVDVILIEPGLIVTRFGDVAAGSLRETPGDGDYATFNRKVAEIISARSSEQAGVYSDGLRMARFPAARTSTSGPSDRSKGKFHGDMLPTTPLG